MKVTVKEKQKEKNCEILFNEIPVGYVYETFDGAVLLKTDFENAIIFKGSDDCDYLNIAHGYKEFPATKILGRLTEIIVEEV